MPNKIETVEELRKQFSPPQNVNQIHREKLSNTDKLALFVTMKIGSMGFFFLISLWVFIWIIWNTVLPKSMRFDPFPAFVLLLFITNVIEILLMPLIMVGQNQLSKHSEIRSEHDYETDKKAEKEIEMILLHLENQQELIERQEKLILEMTKKLETLEKNK